MLSTDFNVSNYKLERKFVWQFDKHNESTRTRIFQKGCIITNVFNLEALNVK